MKTITTINKWSGSEMTGVWIGLITVSRHTCLLPCTWCISLETCPCWADDIDPWEMVFSPETPPLITPGRATFPTSGWLTLPCIREIMVALKNINNDVNLKANKRKQILYWHFIMNTLIKRVDRIITKMKWSEKNLVFILFCVFICPGLRLIFVSGLLRPFDVYNFKIW